MSWTINHLWHLMLGILLLVITFKWWENSIATFIVTLLLNTVGFFLIISAFDKKGVRKMEGTIGNKRQKMKRTIIEVEHKKEFDPKHSKRIIRLFRKLFDFKEIHIKEVKNGN